MNFSDFASIYENHKKSISENKEKYGLECTRKVKSLFIGTLRLNSKDTNEIIRISPSIEVIKSDKDFTNTLTSYYHNLVDDINKIPIETYEELTIPPLIQSKIKACSWISGIGNICEIYSSINFNQMCENMNKKELTIELEFVRIYFILFNCISPLLYNFIGLYNILKGINLDKLPSINITKENNNNNNNNNNTFYSVKNEFILPNLLSKDIINLFYDPIIHLYLFEWIIIINEKLYKIEKDDDDENEVRISINYNEKIYSNISLNDIERIKIWIIKIYSFIDCIYTLVKIQMKYNWSSKNEYNPFEINKTTVYIYKSDISFILKFVTTVNILSSIPNDMKIVFNRIYCDNDGNNNNNNNNSNDSNGSSNSNIEIEFLCFNKNELNINDISLYCLSNNDKSFLVLFLQTLLQHPKLYQFLTIHFHHCLLNEEIILYFSISSMQRLIKSSTYSIMDNKIEYIMLKDGKRKCSNEKCEKYFSDDLKPKTCSKCKRIHYCSKECQIEDWNKKHKVLCKEYISYVK